MIKARKGIWALLTDQTTGNVYSKTMSEMVGTDQLETIFKTIFKINLSPLENQINRTVNDVKIILGNNPSAFKQI